MHPTHCTSKRWLKAIATLLCLLPTKLAIASEALTLECIIEPEMTIELSSAIDGVVQDVLVDKTASVRKDQVLVTLESSTEQAAVALAKSRALMREDIEAKRIAANLANRKQERIVALFNKKSVPGFEKDEAVAAAAMAKLELKRAQSTQKLAKLELARAEADLALRSLRSPIDGVVVERFVHPGESVKDRPVLKLAQIDPMRIEIIADSELFGVISPQATAKITIEGATQKQYQAQVALIDTLIDAASGTFGIRLSLPNPQQEIVGGQKCRATFAVEAIPAAYVNPF